MANYPSRASFACEVDAAQFTAGVIGQQIRQMRINEGLSQAVVARKAGIRPEMLSRLESGRGNPTVRFIERIVRAIEKLAR